jgi:hypothetical protein
MSHNKLFKSLVASSAILLALLATSNAYADDTASEIKALRAQLRELEKRVAAQDTKVKQVRAEVAAAPVAYRGGPVYKGDPRAPGIGPWQFGGVTVTPGGFIALEGAYRSRATGSDFITPFQNLPFNNNVAGNAGEFRLTPRQSRMSMLVQGKVNPVTSLSGYGEFDFGGAAQTANYNQSNSFTPRVRHLYATVDRSDFGAHLLAGQTWSLVTASAKGISPRQELIPLTIDGGYVPGFNYVRQAQIRVTKDLGDFTVAASVENPATVIASAGAAPLVNGFTTGLLGATNNNSANTITLNHVPDIAGKIAYDPSGWGRPVHIEGWGLARDFTNRFGQTTAFASPAALAGGPFASHDTFGGGGGGTVFVSALPKVLDLQFSASYGKGIGRYSTSQLSDVTVDPFGNFHALPTLSMLAGVVYHALPELDIYAYAGQDRITSTSFANNGTNTYGYGNPFYNNSGCNIENSAVACQGNNKVVRQITGGFWDKIYSGDYGRLQVGMQYSYTQRISFPGSWGAQAAATTVGASNIGGVTAQSNTHIIMGSLRYYPFQP